MKRIILRLTIAIITLTVIVFLSYKTVLSARMRTHSIPVALESRDPVDRALMADAVAGSSARLQQEPVLIARTDR